MKKQSTKYPIMDKEFVPPFKITSAIFAYNSHYIGYELTDLIGNKIDFLNIPELKIGIESNPNDFSNVTINKSGQLEIEDYSTLPQEFNEEYEKIRVNNGLLSLLEVDKRAYMPNVVFEYKLVKNSVSKNSKTYKCSFSKDFKKYIKYQTKKKEELELQIPQPLLKIGDVEVNDYTNLFENMDFETFNLDLSLMDLRNCETANGMFKYSKFNDLKIMNFNFNPCFIMNLFYGVTCDVIDLSNCDFTRASSFNGWFFYANIGSVKAKSFKTNKVKSCKYLCGKLFYFTKIDKLDLELFRNFEIRHNDSNYSLFSYLECNKFINMNKLPTKDLTKMGKLFKKLTIDVLDITNLNIDNLEDASYLLSDIICNKMILPDAMFSNVTLANNLFYNTTIQEDLDLSKVTFNKLTENGAMKMFYKATICGKFLGPQNFGSADHLEYTFSYIKAGELDISKCNFSKVRILDNFLSSSSINTIVLPTNMKLIPKKLESADKFIFRTNIEFSNLSEWHFDVAKNLFLQLNQQNN